MMTPMMTTNFPSSRIERRLRESRGGTRLRADGVAI
jgi:hypothetical protein